MTNNASTDPSAAKKRIDESIEVLEALGLPKEQLNERSALTLLASLDLKPAQPWTEASAPLRGITPMTKYLGDISWETEVWVADAPSHMIHFNGERFLGPY